VKCLALVDASGEFKGRNIGSKARKLFYVADELSLLPPDSLMQSLGNLAVNEVFRFLGLSNPISREDLAGTLAEPLAGWPSLSESSEVRTWETRHGLCLSLPGLSTPNGDSDPPRYPFLISRRFIEEQRRRFGASDLRYRCFALGAIPSGANDLVVCDRLLLERMHAREPAQFVSAPKLFAGLDAAFGGDDRCVLTVLAVGHDRLGNTLIECRESIVIPIAPGPLATAEESIAGQCRIECEQRQIPPQRFAYDGTFGGLGAAIARLWSVNTIGVNFAGVPIDPDQARGEVELTAQPVPPSQRFGRRATQLCWRFREAVEAGAMRGVTEEAAAEFSRRRFSVTTRTGTVTRLDVETKAAYRSRAGSSPDIADSICVGLEAVTAAGTALKPIRSDFDREPSNDPFAWQFAEAGRITAYTRGLSRPDLDMVTYEARVAEANYAIDALEHPDPFRKVVTGVPVAETRMPVHTGPPAGEDDQDDAGRAYASGVRRDTFRRIADLLR
jgi:hypothetical protein